MTLKVALFGGSFAALNSHRRLQHLYLRNTHHKMPETSAVWPVWSALFIKYAKIYKTWNVAVPYIQRAAWWHEASYHMQSSLSFIPYTFSSSCTVIRLVVHANSVPLPLGFWPSLISFPSLWLWQQWAAPINGSWQYPFFCVRLVSLSIVNSRFLHVITGARTAFLSKVEEYSIVHIYHIHLSTNGHEMILSFGTTCHFWCVYEVLWMSVSTLGCKRTYVQATARVWRS